MASALSNPGVQRADIRRPHLQVAFDRLPPVAGLEREWWFEPEIPGVYRLVSVNGLRPPYFWQGRAGTKPALSEWLISGRAFLKEDRSWVVRLASGATRGEVSETNHTLLQGTWAPAMPGQLAVRMRDGTAAAWLANGRSILMRGLLASPERSDDMVQFTLRFTRWR